MTMGIYDQPLKPEKPKKPETRLVRESSGCLIPLAVLAIFLIINLVLFFNKISI